MALLSDSDRLQMLKAVGAEEFDTGHADSLWAVFEGEFNNPELSGIPVIGEQRWLECLLSDREKHSLVDGMRLTRQSDGEHIFIRSLEPSRSSGFMVIRIGR